MGSSAPVTTPQFWGSTATNPQFWNNIYKPQGSWQQCSLIQLQSQQTQLRLLHAQARLEHQLNHEMFMAKPQSLLKALVQKTGPIPTFVVKHDNESATVVYSELVCGKELIKVMTNRQLTEVTVTKKFLPEAIKLAKESGRIRAYSIGEQKTNESINFLIAIGRTRKYRANNRYQLKRIYKQLKESGFKQKRRAWPDPKKPNTLGWRVWVWCNQTKLLRSPVQRDTIWHAAEHRVPEWSTKAALRGVAGVHAALMPYDWRRADPDDHDELRDYCNGLDQVHGVVERFGRFVLGTTGWRAEWVIIRALKAPNTEIGLALEKAYPDVEVIYENR